jgi:hypothetical protein
MSTFKLGIQTFSKGTSLPRTHSKLPSSNSLSNWATICSEMMPLTMSRFTINRSWQTTLSSDLREEPSSSPLFLANASTNPRLNGFHYRQIVPLLSTWIMMISNLGLAIVFSEKSSRISEKRSKRKRNLKKNSPSNKLSLLKF